MMARSALTAAQGAMPAGFAAFVAGIGQVSPEGDAAEFDRLLAAAPPTRAPAAATTDAIPVPVPVAGAVAAVVATEIRAALGAEGDGAVKDEAKAEGQGEAHGDSGEPPVAAASAKVAVPAKASPARPETGAGEAAVLAANLLVALSGAVPGPPAKTAKPVDTDAAAQPDAEPSDTAPAAPAPCVPALSVPATPGTAALVVTAALPETLPLDPAPAKATKPAKPAATEAQPAARALAQLKAAVTTPETPPEALPAASATPRARVAALPPLAPLPDAPVAKTGDAGAAPAITILFTQSAAPAIAAPVAAGAPAAIAERVLDMDSDGAWIDQLARDIAATKSDSGDISFRLMPRHLGRLDVAMRQGDEGVTLKMDTQHEATATIVTAAQGRLVDELRHQGVRVAGAEVTHTPGDPGRQSTGQGQGQGRAAPPDPAHLIETANERGEDRREGRAANRRGRFA
ncbi:MAG: flagellar hook-length control protein FliK [Sphingopyxis sp.]|uniref:flagellar hook-length control protein FliK n=1 Tax=Sphingopyxis sp. TaxID=1908224 RepID=UPI0032EE9F4C